MRQDFSINEEESSDTGSTEQLRSPDVIYDTGSPEGHGGEEERLEASLEGENRDLNMTSLVESTDWSQEVDRVEMEKGESQRMGEGPQVSLSRCQDDIEEPPKQGSLADYWHRS